MNEQTEQDQHTYRELLQLWQAENPIKTIKLQFLLASNAGLLGFYALAENNVVLLASGGALLNLVWTLSIGRTVLFQKAWKNKLDAISARHRDDPRFQCLDLRAAEESTPCWLRIVGGVSSRYYLLGAPAGLGLAWLILALRGIA
ncbi:MAG TPA: hypothetical protein ENI97_01870 [Gammaproteobacteria bacterium]|nr:hypothetical protein [Gammaproteobacteria bacterium]